MAKRIVFGLMILVTAIAVSAYRYYNKAHRKVENEVAIAVSAKDIFKDYATNEVKSNEKFLDKAIEVNGVIREISKNQEGQTILVLETGDPFGGVACTMDDTDEKFTKGDVVKIKGICTGYLSDVIITQGKESKN